MGKRKRGRPTVYTAEAAEEIVGRMAEGQSLRSICQDDHLPAKSTVLGWVVDDREGFADRYARARMLQLNTWADEIVEIADGQTEDVQRDRLSVDTRKWVLGKLHPEYADKRLHEHSGKDGGPIQVSEVVVNKHDGDGDE